MIDSRPETLASLVLQKRGSAGVRSAARAIGISPSSLTRIEKGRKVDVETLRKVCAWLDGPKPDALQIAFKNRTRVPPRTAEALAELAVYAARQFSENLVDRGSV